MTQSVILDQILGPILRQIFFNAADFNNDFNDDFFI